MVPRVVSVGFVALAAAQPQFNSQEWRPQGQSFGLPRMGRQVQRQPQWRDGYFGSGAWSGVERDAFVYPASTFNEPVSSTGRLTSTRNLPTSRPGVGASNPLYNPFTTSSVVKEGIIYEGLPSWSPSVVSADWAAVSADWATMPSYSDCCSEVTAECFACEARRSIADYCKEFSFMPGCETLVVADRAPVVTNWAPVSNNWADWDWSTSTVASTTPSSSDCCSDVTAECFACEAKRSIADYCKEFSFMPGCETLVVADWAPVVTDWAPVSNNWADWDWSSTYGDWSSTYGGATYGAPVVVAQDPVVVAQDPVVVVQDPVCSPVMCMMFCDLGFEQDEKGCDVCKCKEHNCMSREVWSAEKSDWCCTNKDLGCPDKVAAEYNCKTREVWSDAKTAWCCKETGFGCPVTPIAQVARVEGDDASAVEVDEPTSAETCADGILSEGNDVCCPKECGTCGGEDCGTRPGGPGSCCRSTIMESAIMCTMAEAPCVVIEAAQDPMDVVIEGVRSTIVG